MAPVSSLGSQSVSSQIWESTSAAHFRGITKCRNPSAMYLTNTKTHAKPSSLVCSVCTEEDVQMRGSTKRRDALLGITVATFSFSSLVSTALAENNELDDFRVYADETKRFKLLIPQDWRVGEGQSDGVRSLTAFFPEETSNSNVSVLISGLGADYTKLESFGKVDEFAETLVSGLDRSWQRPPGVAAKLIDSKSKNGMYYIEYSLQKPGESSRHIYSVLGIVAFDYYNKLYTVTGQFMEDESEKYKSKIEKAISSFRLS